MKAINKEERLAHFSALLEAARQAYASELAELALCKEQYLGSKKIDGSQEEASTVRNVTYELIECQVSADIPSPKIEPFSYSEERCRSALAIERLCSQTRLRLDMEAFNALDERYTYVYGGSVWLVEWDEGRGGRRYKGDISLHCFSPEDFIPQPHVTSVSAMDYCFLIQRTSREELCRRYSLTEAQALLLEGDTETGADTEAVPFYTCFYKNEHGRVSRFIFSGDTVLSDDEDLFLRRRYVCKSCGKEKHLCSCGHYEAVKVPVTTECMPRQRLACSEHARDVSAIARCFGDLPYYVPSEFPIIIRRNTAAENKLLGMSDCRVIRPQQQEINKLESRICQKLMRASVTPMLPEDARISVTNAVFGQVLRLREGENASMYGTLDTTPSIAQDIAAAERLYQHAKRIIGITDTYQGENDLSAISGYAKSIQLAQSNGRLESKRRMKMAAYAELDRLIFLYYLAFADEARPLSFRDVEGRVESTVFSRYDYLAYDCESGEFYYDDDYLFATSKGESPEYNREELYKRNLENLVQGTLGDPKKTDTLLRYWQSQERAHYPFAHENVAYFEELLRRETAASAHLIEAIAEQEGENTDG